MVFGLDFTTGATALTVGTFLIGLLVGVITKRVLKLAVAVVALVVLLAVTGYINLQFNQIAQQTIYRVFSEAPLITSRATEVASILPISSAAFLVGIAIGLWKG